METIIVITRRDMRISEIIMRTGTTLIIIIPTLPLQRMEVTMRVPIHLPIVTPSIINLMMEHIKRYVTLHVVSMPSHDSMIKHECNESLVLSLLVV